MANMSYCRFQNTVADLKDCYDNMDDTDISDNEDEARARWQLIRLCMDIAGDYGDAWEAYIKRCIAARQKEVA